MTIRSELQGMFKNDPLEEVGINGYKAFVRVNQKYSYESLVPSTALEDGSFIGDHIIRRPLTLSIEGNVSDTYLEEYIPINLARRAETILGSFSQYLPNRTAVQLNKISGILASVSNATEVIDDVINKGSQISDYIGLTQKKGTLSQKSFVDYMRFLYGGDQLIYIDMPYKTFRNMRITLLEITKDNESESINFMLEAQEVIFARTVLIKVAPSPALELEGSTESAVDKGIQEGVESSESALYTMKNKF